MRRSLPRASHQEFRKLMEIAARRGGQPSVLPLASAVKVTDKPVSANTPGRAIGAAGPRIRMLRARNGEAEYLYARCFVALDDMHHAPVQHVDGMAVQASDGGASHVIDATLCALNYVHGP